MHLKALRSLLFIPALSSHLFAKAAQRGADALILDLEDAIAFDRKEQARQALPQAVALLAGSLPVLVRVNSAEPLLSADLQALPHHGVTGVLLPKVESAEQVQQVAHRLQTLGHSPASLPLIPLVETPLGVLHLESIATAHPAVGALGFGAEDYAAMLCVNPTPQSMSWAAHAVANCAAAFGLACWGLPGSVTEIDNETLFTELVGLARAMGFTGTVCIHPVQVQHANRGFGPSNDELAWARAVVDAGEQALAQGLGAVKLNGKMIDRPLIERARAWLAMAQR